MNTIPAGEIKRRGIGAVDELLAKGPVHVIRENRPQYVVMTEERYQEFLDAQEEAFEARIRASLEDLEAGRIRRFDSAEELIQALGLEDQV